MSRQKSNREALFGVLATVIAAGVIVAFVSGSCLPILGVVLSITVICWAAQAMNGRGRSNRRRKK